MDDHEKTNPIKSHSRPAQRERIRDVLSPEQIEQLVDALVLAQDQARIRKHPSEVHIVFGINGYPRDLKVLSGVKFTFPEKEEDRYPIPSTVRSGKPG